MKYALEHFIEEAIQLELNASEIYFIFSQAIPEDANFWATLAWEEKNHASVLKTGKEILMPLDQFPGEVLPDVIQALIDTNRWLDSLKEELSKSKPDREKAFAIAVKIESSAGEQHFQRVMESPSDSSVIKIFQELCEDDINHLSRIREYMKGEEELAEIAENEARKILVVIDDEPVAMLLKTILESEGQVDIAGNGSEGLQKIREKDYDLIVSAMEMPIMDGMQFYNQAKEICPGLNKKLIMFMSAPDAEQKSFFRHEGIRHLEKPSTISEIRTAAANIMGNK